MDEQKKQARYIIEYDFVSMTINFKENEPEHRIEIHTLFEEALKAYRRIVKMENILGYSSVKNVKAYRVVPNDELDFSEFLN